jgi:hypothetical protein
LIGELLSQAQISITKNMPIWKQPFVASVIVALLRGICLSCTGLNEYDQ